MMMISRRTVGLMFTEEKAKGSHWDAASFDLDGRYQNFRVHHVKENELL